MCPHTRWLALALLVLPGCADRQPAVVCHNANCAAPFDPASDDTLGALEASLALEHRGKPALDGVEIDLLWSRADGRCWFAHDHEQEHPDSATAVAQRLAEHVARPGAITAGGGPFYLKVELKAGVDGQATPHRSSEADAHAACGIEVFSTISEAANGAGRELSAYFDSESPALLGALVRQAAWHTLKARFDINLSAGFMVPGVGSQELESFDVSLDAVSLHPDWVSAAMLGAVRSRGLGLTLWTRELGSRQLRSIARRAPIFVSTERALVMRAWLDARRAE